MLKKKNLNFRSIWFIILAIIGLVYFKQLIFIFVFSFIIYLIYKEAMEKGEIRI
jgi:hypothetical protein